MTSTAKTAMTVDTSGIKIRLRDVHGSLQTALDDVRDNVRLGLVGVSADATHIGTLEDVLLAGDGISLSTQNSAGDETRTIDADIDGIDIDGTGGESLSIRDMVYLNETDGKWYQQDSDATGSVKMGRVRGCATEAISADGTGKIRILGEVSGFTGLTAGDKVYASTTAGSYTQAKPTTPSTQIILSEMGYAISTTVLWVEPQELTYRKRGTVANGGTLSLEHHVDAETYERDIDVQVIDIVGGSVLETNPDSNHETYYPLSIDSERVGGTKTFSGSRDGDFEIGRSTDQRVAQQFGQYPGVLTQFTVDIGTFSATTPPEDTLTWEIQTDNSGEPSGTVVMTGTFTPIESSTITVDLDDGFIFTGGFYHLVLRVTTPGSWSSGQYINWDYYEATDAGHASTSTNGGSTWFEHESPPNTERHVECSFTMMAVTTKSKLAQGFQLDSGANVGTVRLYLRKYGSPTGDLTVTIVNDDSGSPDETPSLLGTSLTIAESSLTTSFAWYEFALDAPIALSGSTTYWIVLETTRSASDANYVAWAIEVDTPSYAGGVFKQYNGSWLTSTTGDAIFEVLEEDDVYHSQALLDDWGSALATILARLDDGSGSNDTTQTTIKNNTGSEATLELAVTFERGEE